MNTFYKNIFIIIFFLLKFQGNIFAQVNSIEKDGIIVVATDTTQDNSIYQSKSDMYITKKKSEQIPSVAALYSAVLPGLGQGYNGKYWKIPFIYGIIGWTIKSTIDNQKEYNSFLEAYKIRTNGGKDEYFTRLPEKKQLISGMDFYKNKRDFWILLSLGAYAFNILDAYVDAHLLNFDISDDISLKVEPSTMLYPNENSYISYGIKLNLTL